MAERVLVTGAGGFIGGWVAEHFAGTREFRVRAGVRRWAGGVRLARMPMDLVLCDVLDAGQVGQAMRDVSIVVHCATGDPQVNERGTVNVMQAAAACGVRRVVHLSTVDVYGPVAGEAPESLPLRRTGTPYGDSKIAGEEVCREAADRGLPVVILRPSIVYGPYAKLWIAKFAERLASGRWGVLGAAGEGSCNLVYVMDVVQAIRLALTREVRPGEAFNINGAEVPTWNGYFTALNDALGLPPLAQLDPRASRRRLRLTTPLRNAARFALKHFTPLLNAAYRNVPPARAVMKRVEGTLRATPTSGEMLMFSRRVVFPIDHAARGLGYAPAWSVQQGLGLSAQWYKHEYLFTPPDPAPPAARDRR